MAVTSRYYVTSSAGSNLLDFDLSYGTLSLSGQEYVFSGTTSVDSVFVRPGIVFDFTGSAASADKLYLTGNYGDYAMSLAGTVMTLTRTVNQQVETVKVSKLTSELNSDKLVFADGTVSTFNLFAHLSSPTTVSAPAPSAAIETSSAPALSATLNATVKAYAVDSTGETFAPVNPGMNLVAIGSAGVDVVYIKAGSNVDSSSLGGGFDKIYLTGNWSQYTKTIVGTNLVFERTVGADIEYVKVAAATGSSNDVLVFADGTVRSNDAKIALQSSASIASTAITTATFGTATGWVAGWNTSEVTPLPGPTVTITTNDNALKIGDAATLTFTLSEAPVGFTSADVTYAGGVLSNFAGSGTTYTASFTPTVNSTSAATVDVAAGVFANAAGLGNVAAQQLAMTVDTVAPGALTVAPSTAVAVGATISKAESDAGVAVTVSLVGSNAVVGDSVELLLGAASFATPLKFTLTQTEITNQSYTFTIPVGGLGVDGAKSLTAVVIDAAGNAGSASPTLTLSLEAAAPTLISLTNQTPASATTNADTLVYRATFSEPTTAVDAADFVVTGSTATVTNVAAVAGTNAYDITVSGGDLAALNGTVKLGFASAQNITDTATNSLITPTATASYTVDNTAPGADGAPATATAVGTVINGVEAAAGFTVTASLTGTNASAGDTVELKLGGVSFTTPLTHVLTVAEAQASSYTFNVAAGSLGADGAKVLTCVLTDVAGNIGAASTALNLTLDTVAPVAATSGPTAVAGPIISSAEASAGVAVVASLAGTNAVAGDTIELKLGGASFATPLTRVLTSADTGAGSYTFTIPSGGLGATDGAKSLSVVVTDAAGNIGASSPTLSLTLDTVARGTPGAPTAVAGPQINAAEAGAGVAVAVSLTGTNAIAGDIIELKLGGTSFATAQTHVLTQAEVTAGSYTFALPSGSLGVDGSKSLTTVITSVSGNVGTASPALLLTLDTSAPTAATSAPVSAVTAGGVNVTEAASTISVDVSLAGTGAAAGDTLELKLGGASFATPLSKVLTSAEITAGKFTFTIPVGGLGADGSKSLTGVVMDAAGNVGAASNALTFLVETVVPTVTAMTTQTPAGSKTNADTLVYRVTFSESVLNVDATDFTVTGTTATITNVAAVAGTNAYDITVSGGDLAALNGNVSIGFAAAPTQNIKDGGANSLVSPTNTATYTVDNTAPGAGSAPVAAAGPNITATEASAGVAVVASLANTNAVAGDTIELKLGGASFAPPQTHVLTQAEVTSGLYTFTLASGTLGADGTKSLTSVIIDAAGNAGSASAPLSLTLATTSPTLTYSTQTFNEAVANDGSISTAITLSLTGDSFTGAANSTLAGIQISGLPTGLNAVLTNNSTTTATLTITGKAGQHGDANDVSGLSVVLDNTVFASGNAASVTGATKSGFSFNFADPGATQAGTTGQEVLLGTTGKDIIYGMGGQDIINGLAGNDTIDITDAGIAATNSATVVVTSIANGMDTVVGFAGGATSTGGDVLNMSGIANLTDAVVTGQTVATTFANNNVFVFDATPVTIATASAAIAAATAVTNTTGYIVIADSANNNAVTVYHSANLDTGGTVTALALLSGVNITSLTAANFMV
jgi:hypothetical protein